MTAQPPFLDESRRLLSASVRSPPWPSRSHRSPVHSPVFRSECKFFSWAWAEPLVTRDFQTYQTPLRTYELSIFDTVHPPPNLARAMPKLAGWVRSGPDTSGSTWRTSRWA